MLGELLAVLGVEMAQCLEQGWILGRNQVDERPHADTCRRLTFTEHSKALHDNGLLRLIGLRVLQAQHRTERSGSVSISFVPLRRVQVLEPRGKKRDPKCPSASQSGRENSHIRGREKPGEGVVLGKPSSQLRVAIPAEVSLAVDQQHGDATAQQLLEYRQRERSFPAPGPAQNRDM